MTNAHRHRFRRGTQITGEIGGSLFGKSHKVPPFRARKLLRLIQLQPKPWESDDRFGFGVTHRIVVYEKCPEQQSLKIGVKSSTVTIVCCHWLFASPEHLHVSAFGRLCLCLCFVVFFGHFLCICNAYRWADGTKHTIWVNTYFPIYGDSVWRVVEYTRDFESCSVVPHTRGREVPIWQNMFPID